MQRQHARHFPAHFLKKTNDRFFFLFGYKFHLLKMKNVFLKWNKKISHYQYFWQQVNESLFWIDPSEWPLYNYRVLLEKYIKK